MGRDTPRSRSDFIERRVLTEINALRFAPYSSIFDCEDDRERLSLFGDKVILLLVGVRELQTHYVIFIKAVSLNRN
jgi:hypothetical protein